MNLLQIVLVNVAFHIVVEAYSSGGPVDICANPVPWHGAMPQTVTPPVTLTSSTYNYTFNSLINVMISGSGKVEGFMLAAKRVKGDTEELLGTWLNCSINFVKYSWPTTEFGKGNCITHAEEVDKNSFTCQWRAPSINVGDVYFRAAIVISKQTFWLNIKSQVVLAPSPLAANASYTTTYFGSASANGCGSSVGCILYPAGCNTVGNCEAFVTYSKVSDYLDVTLQAQATGYVSLAFSMDRKMGDDETITCSLNPDNNQIEVQRGYNDGYFNSRIRYTLLRQLEAKLSNGYITCRFAMPLSTSIMIGGRIISFDRNVMPFYPFLAIGDVWPGTSAINKHQLTPFRTLMPVDFTSTKIYTFSTLPVLIQFHTFLMILAWLGLALPASHIPAHLRINLGVEPVWRSWIRLHMVTLVIVVCVGIVGVICALVHRGGIAQVAIVHAIFGLVVMTLSIVQIVMGFLRPLPNSRHRSIYNIVHLLNAFVISVFSVICIYLGYNMTLIYPSMSRALNITGSLLLVWNLAAILLFRILRLRAQIKDAPSLKNHELQPSNEPPQLSIVKRGQDIFHVPNWLFITYFVVNSILTLALLVIVTVL